MPCTLHPTKPPSSCTPAISQAIIQLAVLLQVSGINVLNVLQATTDDST
jgi:hypothetical protein